MFNLNKLQLFLLLLFFIRLYVPFPSFSCVFKREPFTDVSSLLHLWITLIHLVHINTQFYTMAVMFCFGVFFHFDPWLPVFHAPSSIFNFLCWYGACTLTHMHCGLAWALWQPVRAEGETRSRGEAAGTCECKHVSPPVPNVSSHYIPAAAWANQGTGLHS